MAQALIILPLFLILFFNLPFRGNRKGFLWASALFCLFQACLSVIPGPEIWQTGAKLSVFLHFNLEVDKLTAIMLFCIAMVSFFAILLSRKLIPIETRRFSFVNLLVAGIAGMNGMVMVRDIFSLYLFLETAAVASFIIIAFKGRAESFEGAFKYIVLSVIATLLMLAGIAILFMYSGSTQFAVLHISLPAGGKTALLAVGLFLTGTFIKSGIFPFQGWVPDAYTAAGPVGSVFLAGIATKIMGVYTLIRAATAVFGLTNGLGELLMFIGASSIVAGALMALIQSDFKRMLAYSSISQIGYIVLGLGSGTPLGIAGAIFHFFNHAVFKSLLFTASAAVEEQTGTRDMYKLGGLGQKMPVTAACSVLASLSTAGIPPLAGFWSKFLIVLALWISGKHAYAAVAILASLLTLAYMIAMQRRIFFGLPRSEFSGVKEDRGVFMITLVALAAFTVLGGLFFSQLLKHFMLPAAGILM